MHYWQPFPTRKKNYLPYQRKSNDLTKRKMIYAGLRRLVTIIFIILSVTTFLVGRELQTLHSLRRMFVNDLRARVRRAQVGFNSIRRLCPQLGIYHIFVFT